MFNSEQEKNRAVLITQIIAVMFIVLVFVGVDVYHQHKIATDPVYASSVEQQRIDGEQRLAESKRIKQEYETNYKRCKITYDLGKKYKAKICYVSYEQYERYVNGTLVGAIELIDTGAPYEKIMVNANSIISIQETTEIDFWAVN